MQYAVKVLISAALIVAIAEIGKRNVLAAAVTASLPLISVLAFVWLYLDTRNSAQIASLSSGVFWLVLPSLVLFLVLPFLLHRGMDFWLSLTLACIATVASYLLMIKALTIFKIL